MLSTIKLLIGKKSDMTILCICNIRKMGEEEGHYRIGRKREVGIFDEKVQTITNVIGLGINSRK